MNEALHTIQDKIILPAYLPEKQRELVFDPKMRNYIKQNPVVIELDGLEHKFSTIDRFKDVPNSKKALAEVLTLMETREDWSNLGTLLAGYKKAGIRLHRKTYSKIVRMAGKKKQAYAIIECAKQTQKTGLVLNRKEYVVQLLQRINEKITSPSGDKSEAAQALKWNDIVIDLIQQPEHRAFSNQPTSTPLNRLHLLPIIRGMLLFAQTSTVQAKQAAEESTEKEIEALKVNVDLIQNGWKFFGLEDLSNSKILQDLNPHSTFAKSANDEAALAPNNYILTVVQNIKGLELAQEILGESAKELEPVQSALEKHLGEFVQGGGPYREVWGSTYESVIGRKPDWPAASK